MRQNIVYFTDVHYGATPSNRKDNYNESILKKVEFCFKLARKNDAIVIIGGDLFDSPRMRLSDVIPLFQLFYYYRDLKIYCIRGNEGHDGFEGKSALDIFKVSGVIRPHNPSEKISDDLVLIFADHGVDYSTLDDHCVVGAFNLLVTHTTIVKDEVIFDHILMDNFKTCANLVTVAHYHPYQGTLRRGDGVTFVAPGALARRKRVEHDMCRAPKCAVIVVEHGKLLGVKEVDLPHEKDVWTAKGTLETLDDVWYHKEVADNVASMKSEADAVELFLSLEDSLKQFAKNRGTKQAILDMSMELINEVR